MGRSSFVATALLPNPALLVTLASVAASESNKNPDQEAGPGRGASVVRGLGSQLTGGNCEVTLRRKFKPTPQRESISGAFTRPSFLAWSFRHNAPGPLSPRRSAGAFRFRVERAMDC